MYVCTIYMKASNASVTLSEIKENMDFTYSSNNINTHLDRVANPFRDKVEN